jgi:hypothetical protein
MACTGVFALVVGLHDALLAASLASRLAGGGIAVGGVLLFVAAVQARRPGRADEGWRALLGIAAGAVETCIGAFLLVAAFDEPAASDDRRWWGWAALMTVGVATMVLYFAIGRGRLARSLGRPVSIVASGAAISVVLGLVQLWQSAASSPSQTNPNLALTIALRPLPPKDGLERFAASFTARNLSDVPLLVLGSRYAATGIDMTSAQAQSDEAFTRRLRRDARVSADLTRAEEPAAAELAQAGAIAPDDFTFFPDEVFRTSRVISIRPRRYDRLVVTADVAVAREDRLEIDLMDPDNPLREFPQAGVLNVRPPIALSETLPVLEESWVRRLTRPAVDLRRVYVADAGSGLDTVLVYGQRRNQPDSEGLSAENVQIGSFYGLSAAEATRELYIGPGAVPTAVAGSLRKGRAFVSTTDGRRTWLLGSDEPPGDHAFYAVAQGEHLWPWKRSQRCPPRIPAHLLESAGLRDPRSGACVRPILAPSMREPARKLSFALEAVSGAGDRRPLETPFDASLALYPNDYAGREQAQRVIRQERFGGGACLVRTVVGVPVRTCSVALKRPGGAERVAASWMDIRSGLWFQAERITLPGLREPVAVVTFAGGGAGATEAVTAFTRGRLATVIVAGDGPPRYVKSAVRRQVRRIQDALDEAAPARAPVP